MIQWSMKQTTSSKTGSQQRDKNKETRKKGLKRL
jgi:hypothetical protein